MIEFLGQYSVNYEKVCPEENKEEKDEEPEINEINDTKIYTAYNKITKKDVVLKVISKQKLKEGDYDFLLEQLNREEQLTKLCRSPYIVNLYQRLETDENIIFELEEFTTDLSKYLFDNGELANEKSLFKEVVISLAKALKVIHEKGVMHRDIKPNNVFMRETDDGKQEIKLGDFGCSILIKDNTSEPIGTIVYCAPEIIKNVKYDEKCDLWSLGLTLFELYFGVLPYGHNPNTNKIKKVIYDPNHFIFRKSNIPSLDILFKRLLVINPKDRMTFDEFFDYVLNDNFMKDGVIYVNNNPKYKEIYKIIQSEPQIDYPEEYTKECDNEAEQAEQNMKKIMTYVEGGHLPDIMNYANGVINNDGKFNNIIYYDENINFLSSINEDSDYFERQTPGAFLLCTKLDSLKLVSKEVVKQAKKDKRIAFNLITTGSKCDKIMDFLKEKTNQEFKNCIKNVCIYCMNLEKWKHLKDKYPLVHSVCNDQFQVVNFIKSFASEEIKAFPVTKLITLADYNGKYKERHFAIAQFYGDLTVKTYKEYLEKMKSLIKEEDKNKKLKCDKNKLLESFLTFDIKEDLKKLDKLIIKEYTKNTFYGDLNKWLMDSKMNFYEPIAYFTARLMYSLNSYANLNNMYCNEDRELHRGAQLTYTCVLPYERAKGKVILLSAFTSTSESEILAQAWAGRGEEVEIYKNNLKFSVVFIIRNKYKKKWVSNGINVQKESQFKQEKEFLYQPFSFYFVRDVQIDTGHYTADIYLETIGKTEILEEQIKQGKQIEYNKKEGLIQIKK